MTNSVPFDDTHMQQLLQDCVCGLFTTRTAHAIILIILVTVSQQVKGQQSHLY